jgi:hypothetical protein
LIHGGRKARPFIPLGRYFRMLLMGYFEGMDSDRGICRCCAEVLWMCENQVFYRTIIIEKREFGDSDQ